MEKENKNSSEQTKYQKVKKPNDYIFKRYRYQANNILKNCSNDVPHYQANKKQAKSANDFQFKPQIIQFQDQPEEFQNQNQEQIQTQFSGIIQVKDHQDTRNSVVQSDIKKKEQFLAENIILFDQQISNQQNQESQSKFSSFLKYNLKEELKNEINQKYSQFPISPHSPNEIISLNQSLYSPACLQQSATSLIKRRKPFNHQKSNGIQTNGQNQFEDKIEYEDRDREEQNQELKGVKITSKSFEDNIIIQIIDKNLFCTSKIPPGIILKCKLKRQSSFLSSLSPEYDLYLQNGLKHIVSAKKYPFRNRQLFKFSTKLGDFEHEIQRSLMANLSHNGYWLIDQPRQIQYRKISYLDILIYYQQIESHQKNREMRVFIPPSLKSYHIGLQFDTPHLNFDWFKKQIHLQLTNKLRNSNYCYKKQSDKNFVLIDQEDEDYFYLKVQKSSDNIFDVQIQHPLTPMQAMAIIMTRFDAQLK